MARNENIALATGVWTQITNGDVTGATFQNRGNLPIIVMATVGQTPPDNGSDAGLIFAINEGEDAGKTLAQLFPGVSGANRLYAKPQGAGPARLFVSHA